VLLHGVGRHHQPLGDLGGRVALQHQPGDGLLALGQPVGRHQQRRDPGRVGGLDDHRHAAGAAGDQGGAMQHDPGARARHGDLAALVGVLGGPERPAGDRQHRGRQLAGVPVAVRKLLEPVLDAGGGRLDLPVV
jgi:hypothetical protein